MNKRREQGGSVSSELRNKQREASEKVQEINKEMRELKTKIQVSVAVYVNAEWFESDLLVEEIVGSASILVFIMMLHIAVLLISVTDISVFRFPKKRKNS